MSSAAALLGCTLKQTLIYVILEFKATINTVQKLGVFLYKKSTVSESSIRREKKLVNEAPVERRLQVNVPIYLEWLLLQLHAETHILQVPAIVLFTCPAVCLCINFALPGGEEITAVMKKMEEGGFLLLSVAALRSRQCYGNLQAFSPCGVLFTDFSAKQPAAMGNNTAAQSCKTLAKYWKVSGK